MPPRSLNAPMAVWFSCLTKTSAPARAHSRGQRICGVGGTSSWTSLAAASRAGRSGRTMVLSDLEHRFNFDGDVVGEAGDTERGAGVAAGFAEDFDEQIGTAVDDRRVLSEIGSCLHEAKHFDDTPHAVERAEGGLRGGQQARAS